MHLLILMIIQFISGAVPCLLIVNLYAERIKEHIWPEEHIL
jgi:hypothetical protein